MQFPVVWLIALSVTQLGILWWRVPWSIGVGVAAIIVGIVFKLPTVIFGYAGFMVQGWLPLWFFRRRLLDFDMGQANSLTGFLIVGVMVNSLLSTLCLLPLWSAFQTFQNISFAFALLWLLHCIISLVLVLPGLRFGTHMLKAKGLWASEAARQRSINKPHITRMDIMLLLGMQIIIVIFSNLFHASLDIPFDLTNVLFLLPTVILMTHRGFDGALLAGASGLVIAVSTVVQTRNINPILENFTERMIFASITFEMGIYYLISIVVGLLIDAQRSERSRLTMLLNLNRAFSKSSNPSNALDKLANAIADALSYAECVIYAYDLETDMLKPLIAAGGQQRLFLQQPLNLTQFPSFKQPLQTNTTSILHSSQLNSPADISFFWLQTGYITAMLVPLSGVQHPSGLIGIFDARPERNFTAAEIHLVEVMCAHAVTAFDQQHLITTLQTQATHLNAVAEISTILNESLDIEHVSARMIQQIERVVPHDWAVVMLYNDRASDLRIVTETAWHGELLFAEIETKNLMQAAHKHIKDNYPERVVLSSITNTCVDPLKAAGLNVMLRVPLGNEAQKQGMLLLASQATDAFRELNHHILTLVVRHMTLAIANASLYVELREAYEAQEQAQDTLLKTERYRALGELASGIAHDFNNLLTAIMGNAQLLHLDPDISADAQTTLSVIEQAVRDGHHMIQRIQHFVGAHNSTVTAIDLHSIIRDVIALTRPRWLNKQPINVQLDLAPIPTIIGSGYEIRQVLTNLIINAIDAMPEGGNLTLSIFQHSDEIVIQVKDSGTGMDEATQQMMWTPFFSTKGEYGTGLGMSMVHRIIVQYYGGRIDVTSTINQGTAISLYLPVNQAEQTRPEIKASKTDSKAQGRVLIIEHDELVRSSLVRLVQLWGYHVTEAASGQRARRLIAGHTYHAVIADAALTDINIWHLLEYIRHISPQAAIILLNSMLQHNENEHHSALIDAYLPKPIEFTQLKQTLQQHLAVQGIS